ncbi:MAG: phosphatidylserine decarboxylase family protein [Planctomycetaceae bacterium]
MSDFARETLAAHSAISPAALGIGPPGRAALEPMDPRVTDIQPGSGVVMRLEQAWGLLRRAYLKAFRRGYVARMAALRQGDRNPCPHEVLDPRDLKFHRNQPGWHWKCDDDPFAWRDRIPFARVGLAELLVFSVLLYGGAIAAGWLTSSGPRTWETQLIGWAFTAILATLGGLVTWFFRDPEREIPTEAGVVVSPADGLVVAIDELDDDEFIGGPAVRIGIFLSIFNVHINRAPIAGRVIGIRYEPGKFLNALRPESARENERLILRYEGTGVPYRRMVLAQITGAIARRIVCWVKPGDELAAGERFGMIKLGSRTELTLPREPGLEIAVKIGDAVHAGGSALAHYSDRKIDDRKINDETGS